MDTALSRVAGAPISWGVCEVPDWGHQMPAARVLAEMAALGLPATEAGPDGFLPADPERARRALDDAGLLLVGGFVPAVLHEPDDDAGLEVIRRAAVRLRAAGGQVVVLAADTSRAGYDASATLDNRQLRTLLQRLDAAQELCAHAGMQAVLHPHVGTVVERTDQVEQVLDGSTIPLCLDTGHLLAGGTDPAVLASRVPERIGHVHFKDVDAGMAERVRAGDMAYSAAVGQGMYRPLGEGDVDVAAIVEALCAAGYDGWWVLEQDVMLAREPEPDSGPRRDVQRSINHLRTFLES